MADSYAGISVPEGDPGALRESAQRLGAVGSQLQDSATEMRGMPSMLGSWQGPASASYAGTCLSQSEALSRQGQGWTLAAGATKVFADELEDARREARAAIDDARDTKARIKQAKAEIAAATERLADADRRTGAAELGLSVGGLVGAAGPEAHEALRRAREDADSAERELRHWRRVLEDAEDDLERAQRRGQRAEQAAEDAASTARVLFAGIGQQLPRLVLAAPAAKPEGQPDKPWYEDALGWTGDRIEGLARGAGEGFTGLAEGGAMLYRLSNLNGMIDPEGHRREHEKLGRAADYAWQHPGEFGKALVNWEDLAAGRYDEWIGNLAPDALGALVTGGMAPMVSRGGKGADAAGDMARGAERLGEGGRAYERAQGAHEGLPTKALKEKTTASNGDPTLSGWKHRPDGYGAGAPEDVRKLSDDIGHHLEPHFFDHLDKPDGFPGKFNASHAEKQQALTSPGSDIATTRSMCPDCQEFHRKLAEHTGQPQLVTDPDTTRLFLPDGSVVKSPGLDDFPRLQDPSSFDGRAAAAGGAGSEGLSASQRDGGR